jgi:hypothetical protein
MMTHPIAKASTAILLLTACAALAGCADMANSNARPGDYASNYFSAPMSSLYPGNYPQSAASTISSH